MKHLLPALLLVSCSAQILHAQGPPNWTWARQTQGGFYEDAYSVTSDPADNVIAVGYYSNDTCFVAGDTMINAGSADYYIVKHDQFGTPLWSQHVGGSGEEYGVSVACDANSNIVVVGTFASASITIGTMQLNNVAPGTPDVFVAKYSPSGNVLWATSFGGTDWDYVSGVTIENSTGNIYVSGAYYNSSLIIGTDTMLNRGTYDMYLAKFNPSGVPLWARDAGGNRNDLANAVALDHWSGDVYISGGFASDTLPFAPDTLVNAFGTQPDIFTVRYDMNGNCIWARREGSLDNDHSVSIGLDWWGRVYVAGHYHSTSFVFGNDTLVNNGMGDVFMIVYDTLGNPLWSKSFGGPDHDFGHSVAVYPSGWTLLTGMFMSMSMTVGSATLMNASMDEDIFIAEYTDTGMDLGAVAYGGGGRDYLNCIHIAPSNGSIYVAGSFGSSTLTCGPDVLSNTDPGGTGEALIGRMDIPMLITGPALPENSLSVFPNPSDNVINFSSEGIIETITIYNAIGQQVKSVTNVNATVTTIDLSGEASGIYFYSVQSAGGARTGTIVKE